MNQLSDDCTYSNHLPKLFQIGHNKTATRSIFDIFISNGYRAFHWEKGNLAKKIFDNFVSDLPLLDSIEDAHLYSDLESERLFYSYKLFPQLDLEYPGSYFIYNSRDVNAWIKSRLKHAHGEYAKECLQNLVRKGVELSSVEDLAEHWKSGFIKHEKNLRKYFENKNNLIEVDIDSDESKQLFVEKLINLGFEIKESTFPHVGRTLQR